MAAKEQMFICGVDRSTRDRRSAVLGRTDRILPPILDRAQEHCGIVAEWISGEPLVDWVAPAGGVVCFIRVRADVAFDADDLPSPPAGRLRHLRRAGPLVRGRRPVHAHRLRVADHRRAPRRPVRDQSRALRQSVRRVDALMTDTARLVVGLLVALSSCRLVQRHWVAVPSRRVDDSTRPANLIHHAARARPPQPRTRPASARADCMGGTAGMGCNAPRLPVPLDWSQALRCTSRPRGRIAARRRVRAARVSARWCSTRAAPGSRASSSSATSADARTGSRRVSNQRFDIVSWDTERQAVPRRRSGARPGQEFEEPELDPTPDTPAEVSALDAKAHRDAAACIAQGRAPVPPRRHGEHDPRSRGAAPGARRRQAELRRLQLRHRHRHVVRAALPGPHTGDGPRRRRHPRRPTDRRIAPPGAVVRAQPRRLPHRLRPPPACTFGHGDPKGALRQAHRRPRGAARRLPASLQPPRIRQRQQHARTRRPRHRRVLCRPDLAAVLARRPGPRSSRRWRDATDGPTPSGFRLLSFRDQLAGRQTRRDLGHVVRRPQA